MGTAGQMMVKGGGSTLGRLSDIREVEDKTFIIYNLNFIILCYTVAMHFHHIIVLC